MGTVIAANYKGYVIRLAAYQPSKARRGGHTRSVQVLKDGLLAKAIRFDAWNPYGANEAVLKAKAWVDEHEKGVR